MKVAQQLAPLLQNASLRIHGIQTGELSSPLPIIVRRMENVHSVPDGLICRAGWDEIPQKTRSGSEIDYSNTFDRILETPKVTTSARPQETTAPPHVSRKVNWRGPIDSGRDTDGDDQHPAVRFLQRGSFFIKPVANLIHCVHVVHIYALLSVCSCHA